MLGARWVTGCLIPLPLPGFFRLHNLTDDETASSTAIRDPEVYAAAQKLSFAFTIFDADSSGELTQEEVRQFFDLLRLPIAKIIDDAMNSFYAVCGYETDFRAVVSDLTERSLQRHIDAVVKDAMELDVDENKMLNRDEFMMWGHKNRHFGRWVDAVSRFVVGSLVDLKVSDFMDDDWAE